MTHSGEWSKAVAMSIGCSGAEDGSESVEVGEMKLQELALTSRLQTRRRAF